MKRKPIAPKRCGECHSRNVWPSHYKNFLEKIISITSFRPKHLEGRIFTFAKHPKSYILGSGVMVTLRERFSVLQSRISALLLGPLRCRLTVAFPGAPRSRGADNYAPCMPAPTMTLPSSIALNLFVPGNLL